MPIGKTGVLLINLGTPDNPTRKSVYRYLIQFLTDGRVIDIPWLARQLLVRGIIAPFRSGSSAKLYQELWTENGSPIKFYGERVKDLVQSGLGEDYHVSLGMRYQSPSIASAVQELLQANVKEIVVFPMFPQYASATTGSVFEEVMRILSKEQAIPAVRMINSYHDHPKLLDVFVENASRFDLTEYDHVMFSFHGLPQRQLRKADRCDHCLKSDDCCLQLSERNQHCYSAQCYATAFALAERLNLTNDRFSVCFQSRLGNDPWIQPYTSDILKQRAEKGDKKLLVFSPAFVADCLETIIEISTEYQEEFEEMGGQLVQLVPSLNDHPKWIEAIIEMVKAQ